MRVARVGRKSNFGSLSVRGGVGELKGVGPWELLMGNVFVFEKTCSSSWGVCAINSILYAWVVWD